MDNNKAKSLILKERVRNIWVNLWLVLIIANVVVYINDPLYLSVGGSGFNSWIVNFLSPHNWLMLATALLTLNGLRSIWLMCEQKWPVIENFRFVPIAVGISGVLVFIGVTF